MADEHAARLEKLVEDGEQAALGCLRLASLSLDSLADVVVEQLDRLPSALVRRGGIAATELDEGADRHAGGDELHSRRDRIEVLGGVERLIAAFDRNQESCRL